MHNLSGTWKSVDNTTLNVKRDKGIYVIKQEGNKITVYGGLAGKFKNFGYAELDDTDEFTITWTDSYDSKGNNVVRCVYKVKILNQNRTETTNFLQGGKDMSFGTWEKISGSDSLENLNFENQE